MSIKTGEKMPQGAFTHMGPDGPAEISSDELFQGKKVVLFAVPGAYTPTCSEAHMPGFVAQADKIKAKGVDTIACLAVNDVFVMDAWSKQQNAEHLLLLADGSAEYVNKLGLSLDLVARGLGVRSQRFAMIIDDGTVSWMAVEDGPVHVVSTADEVLKQL